MLDSKAFVPSFSFLSFRDSFRLFEIVKFFRWKEWIIMDTVSYPVLKDTIEALEFRRLAFRN